MNSYAYRLPGERDVKTGCSERLIRGFGKSGFVIAPFDGNPAGVVTIPNDGESCTPAEIFGTSHYTGDLYSFPTAATARDTHSKGVEEIKNLIGSGHLNKCVLARVAVVENRIDLEKTFFNLCIAYPEAFVFFFSTPLSGTWIGASPEILMISDGNHIETMSLAGTRRAGSNIGWDAKNREEQQIVTEFISQKLKDKGLDPEIGEVCTRKAGPVEHLMTRISASTRDGVQSEEIARILSPTPALSGFPREKAMQAIKCLESFDRGYYGGFCGPIDKDRTSLYVNLRSMRVGSGKFCLIAGGGIMEDSIASDEWDETERKIETCSSAVVTIESEDTKQEYKNKSNQ